MDSVVLTAQVLNVINEILNDVTGYGRERTANFSVNLFEDEDDIKFTLIYINTGKFIFEGTINEENLIDAIKNEDEKQERKRERENNSE